MSRRQLIAEYELVLSALDLQDRTLLKLKASMLRQMSGEDWAIAELVERACNLLDKLEEE